MELKTEKNETALTIGLSGELNAITAPEVETQLTELLPGIQDLTLDFTNCDYVSSSGIRVLLSTQKKMKAANGAMHLTNVGKCVMDIFVNTMLDSVFDIR
ncbi:MAG: STAS domain-containing protein [Lachnospiraceae bacterium]|jgi:anti-sigma B factor antagonist|nr:STAS domain-containing protein [Lachnospiraceae bacterium]